MIIDCRNGFKYLLIFIMLLILLVSYFIGSIPFGLIITKAAGLPDIRTIGSGNIGATNVLRTGKKHLAVCTLVLDMLKGFLAVQIAGGFSNHPLLIIFAAAAAVVGHMFPIWLKFKGGKGVATTLGAYLSLSLPFGLTCIAIWVVSFAISRISSLSALLAIGLAPLVGIWLYPDLHSYAILTFTLISALVAVRHKSNIERMSSKQELTFKGPA